MMKHSWRALLAASLIACVSISGCVQFPTEKASIIDLRPQISFRLADDSIRPARVLIDGIDVGATADFLDGIAALRVLPGTHVLKVTFMGTTLMNEQFYLGDGVQRTFTVMKGF
jgi:hypothetical protein